MINELYVREAPPTVQKQGDYGVTNDGKYGTG